VRAGERTGSELDCDAREDRAEHDADAAADAVEAGHRPVLLGGIIGISNA
jgi:hypothetical protein